jgi:activator of 2-hydroxyglutaryl-CoA dehydratase
MADVPMPVATHPVTLTVNVSCASCAGRFIEEASCRLVCTDWAVSLLATHGG